MKKLIICLLAACLAFTYDSQAQDSREERLAQIAVRESLEEKDRAFMELYKQDPKQSFGFLPFTLAQEFAGKGDEAKMVFYADIFSASVSDASGAPIGKEMIYSQVAGAMIGANPDAAAKYLKAGVEQARASLNKALNDPNERPDRLARSKSNYYAMWANYTRALLNGSDPEKGFALIADRYRSVTSDPDADPTTSSLVTSQFLDALISTGRFKEAFPLIEEAIQSGAASDRILANLERAYIEFNGSAEGFEAYRRAVFEVRDGVFLKEIAGMAIDQAAPDFELRDVDGSIVQLSDLKGKVVVLDFWATWCGPCKASFPGMQQAVNKYKDDENVVFFFIHTWEKGGDDPTTAAKKYIVDNNYTFKVLMDLRDPAQNNQSAVAAAYQVSGIPTKVIIDPKGRIRFKTSGFSPDIEKAVYELSAMIEFAREG